MGYKIIEMMKNAGTDQVKTSAAYFVAQLINNQYLAAK